MSWDSPKSFVRVLTCLFVLLLVIAPHVSYASNQAVKRNQDGTYHYKNWAGNIEFDIPRYFEPTTVDEIQEIVRNSTNIRVLGTSHAANPQLQSNDTLINLTRMRQVLSCCDNGLIRVQAGVSFHDINHIIDSAGYALETLPCTPEISLLGSILTSSHGSGSSVPPLHAYVQSMDFVDANGNLHTLSPTHPHFTFATTSLGLFGVIVSYTLKLTPRFHVHQCVYQDIPIENVISPYFSQFQYSALTGQAFSTFVQPKISLTSPVLPFRTVERYSHLSQPNTVVRKPLSPLQAQSNLEHFLSASYSVSLFTVFEHSQARMGGTKQADYSSIGKDVICEKKENMINLKPSSVSSHSNSSTLAQFEFIMNKYPTKVKYLLSRSLSKETIVELFRVSRVSGKMNILTDPYTISTLSDAFFQPLTTQYDITSENAENPEIEIPEDDSPAPNTAPLLTPTYTPLGILGAYPDFTLYSDILEETKKRASIVSTADDAYYYYNSDADTPVFAPALHHVNNDNYHETLDENFTPIPFRTTKNPFKTSIFSEFSQDTENPQFDSIFPLYVPYDECGKPNCSLSVTSPLSPISTPFSLMHLRRFLDSAAKNQAASRVERRVFGSGVEGYGTMPPTESMVLSSVWFKVREGEQCPDIMDIWEKKRKMPHYIDPKTKCLYRPSKDVSLNASTSTSLSSPIIPSPTIDSSLNEVASVPIIPGRITSSAVPFSLSSWHTRLPHFVPGFDDQSSHGDYDELQTEYGVPMVGGSAVLSEIIYHPELQRIPELLHISEIRLTRGDSNPLSMCYDPLLQEQEMKKMEDQYEGEINAIPLDAAELSDATHVYVDFKPQYFNNTDPSDAPLDTSPLSPSYPRRGCLHLQFTWRKSMMAKLNTTLPIIEEIIKRHNGRPHWGKFNMYSVQDMIGVFGKDRYQDIIQEFNILTLREGGRMREKHPFQLFTEILQHYDSQSKFKTPYLYNIIVEPSLSDVTPAAESLSYEDMIVDVEVGSVSSDEMEADVEEYSIDRWELLAGTVAEDPVIEENNNAVETPTVDSDGGMNAEELVDTTVGDDTDVVNSEVIPNEEDIGDMESGEDDEVNANVDGVDEEVSTNRDGEVEENDNTIDVNGEEATNTVNENQYDSPPSSSNNIKDEL